MLLNEENAEEAEQQWRWQFICEFADIARSKVCEMWVKMRVNRRQTRAILQSLIIAWLFFINSTGRNHGIIRYNWIANTTHWADISSFWVCYQITLFFSLFLFYFRCLAAYEATRKCAHTKTADVQSVIWYLSDSELWQLRLVVCDEMSTNKRNAIIN